MANTVPNKLIRERKEIENLFCDKRYCRDAWKSIGNAILASPATVPIVRTDKDGNEDFSYTLEKYSYNNLKDDIAALCKASGSPDEPREPTQIEMILTCQIVKARYDTGAATFIRDTLGAKPVDETKLQAQVSNPYESMTDEELAMLAAWREGKSSDGGQI